MIDKQLLVFVFLPATSDLDECESENQDKTCRSGRKKEDGGKEGKKGRHGKVPLLAFASRLAPKSVEKALLMNFPLHSLPFLPRRR